MAIERQVRSWDGPDREAVEAVVAAGRDALLAAGFPVRSRRFPFAMHHDAMRTRLRGAAGRTLRHEEVATLLCEWSQPRGPTAYARQAVAGAVIAMCSRDRSLVGRAPGEWGTPDASFQVWAADAIRSSAVEDVRDLLHHGA